MQTPSSWNEPLGIGLWHSSWQASVLIGLVLFLHWLFGTKLSPGWRYSLWLLVLARLALPFTPESNVSIFNVALFDPLRPLTPGAESFEQLSMPSPSQPNLSFDPSSIVKSFSVWVPMVWILGVLFQVVRIFWQNVRFSNRVKDRVLVTRPDLIELLEECKALMGVRLHLSLFETPQVGSPSLYGLFRPRLLLPENLIESFSRQELRHVLLHELAHVKRSDMVVNWLITVLQTLHWFNPVIWFAFRRMKADRELACDALALARANEADTCPYGETIIKLLEGFTRLTPSPSLLGILEEKSQIQRRIRMIANFETSSRRSGWAVLLLVGGGFVGLTDARTPNVTDLVPGDASGASVEASEKTPQKNALSSMRVTGRVIDKATTKTIPIADLTRSRESQPTSPRKASSGVATARVGLATAQTKKGGIASSVPVRLRLSETARKEPGGTGSMAGGLTTAPTNGPTIAWKFKNREPRICITDRLPVGAFPLILQPESFATAQQVAL